MSEDATAAPKLNRVLYGKQTQLSLQSFTQRARRLRDIPAFVRNYALVKRAAAQANLTLGRLDEQRALAIIDACDEIADGSHLEQFPTALVLGGGGTTSNMNLNEVIASRASQIGQIAVHPNDHANASQSTNDTFPTAMALTLMDLAQAPLAALHELTESLCTKAQEYADTPYLGRTCLQDAVTVYAGQTLRGQARAVRRATEQLRDAVSDLAAVPLGKDGELLVILCEPEKLADPSICPALVVAAPLFVPLFPLLVESAANKVELELGKWNTALKLLSHTDVGVALLVAAGLL